MKEFKSCTLCPRECGVNRNNGELGFCQASNKIKIARYSIHYWEEPCISGSNGSGTVFFSNCSLKCIYCQNYEISTKNCGKEISVERFAQICLYLQNKGALNINLVTPTHFIPLIRDGIIKAKEEGLTIPIVYNTSSYENLQALKLLDGLIDIYLADLKYFDDTLAKKLSRADNYFHFASLAIKEMYKQVGKNVFDDNGIMKKGIIVRHLVLPKHIDDSKEIINYLYNNYKDNIYISIMNQYTPLREIKKYPELNCKLEEKEYDEIINYALDIGVKNAFVQEGETQDESFIPDFSRFDEF